ncbi:tyrosine phosphatase family protein [Sarocladium implicatum]|nr:tyrosine phosphatase family protein [Sarocladium implicatum]
MDNLVQLESVTNFRDVGKTVNQFLGQKVVREGVLFRSARLDDATSRDQCTIRDDIGVKTVIDLRTKSEIGEQATKYKTRPGALRLHSRSSVAQPFHIQGLAYHEIKITGGPFERFLVSLLPLWSILKLLLFVVLGYRLNAIKIITKEVMIPRGLLTLGNDTLDRSGRDIKKVLQLYAQPQAMPNLIHCTHGKDRTGLICMLVLMILDVPVKAIEYDYHLTDLAVKQDIPGRLAEVREVGLADDWIYTASGQISCAAAHLKERYGGLGPYLDYIGLSQEDQDRMREALLY